jgi:S-adenosylmethionine-dependent methyltransferase
MAKQPQEEDRNFDDLAQRFKNNVYGGLKGEIRLTVLNRDFRQVMPNLFAPALGVKPLRILDAGGGQGQFSLQFAEAGHHLVICDISAEMLKLADDVIQQKGLQDRVTLIHCSIKDLAENIPTSIEFFDCVLCHAVIEWMVNPESLLPCLMQYLTPKGCLSFTYYNVNSLIYKNLLRTNFTKVINKNFSGARGSLTPINPLSPDTVAEWFNALPLSMVNQSGIRVFHDYIFDDTHRNRDTRNLIELELQYSQQQPFLFLGRYIHIMAIKD